MGFARKKMKVKRPTGVAKKTRTDRPLFFITLMSPVAKELAINQIAGVSQLTMRGIWHILVVGSVLGTL
jgi:hypothetical protein